MAKDPSTLYALLLNTGLQQKDNPTYQVIHDLIGHVVNVNKTITSPSSPITVVGPVGPQGIQGISGISGLNGLDSEPDDFILPPVIPTNPLIVGSIQAGGTGSAGVISIGPFTLNDAINPQSGLGVTVTLPTVTTAIRTGINFDVTSAGASSHDQQGCVFTLHAGYTGTSRCYALNSQTDVASAGFTIGVQGKTSGASAVNIGINAFVSNGTQNIGVFAGVGVDGSTFSTGITAAIVVANGTTASDLFRAYSNITLIASLTDAGLFNSKSLSSSSTIVATGNITSSGGYIASGGVGANSPNAGDLVANRGGASPGTGAIFFGSSASLHYLYYDGTKFNFTDAVNITGSIVASVNFQAGTSAFYTWSTRSAMSSPADGKMNYTNQAVSVGIGLDFTTDSVLALRNRAQNADASLTALNVTASGLYRFNGTNSTGVGLAVLTMNCPAANPANPYTWLSATAADGSAIFIPAWK